MPEYDVSTRDIMEKRLREATEELGRLKMDDEKRSKLLNEIKTLTEALNAMDQVEITRINNNFRNQIDDEKVNVEMEKIKTEKKKMWVGLGQVVVGALLGLGINITSYKLDEWMQPDRKMGHWAEACLDMLKPRNMR